MSTYQILQKAGVSEKKINIINIIMEAYTYPSLDKLPAALFVPFGVKAMLNGMFNKTVALTNGTSEVIVAMKNFIISTNRGRIITSSSVVTIKKGKVVLNDMSRINYDNLVIATHPSIKMMGGVIKMKRKKKSTRYTHYDFITIKLTGPARINGQEEWFGAYQSSAEVDTSNPRFSSFLNLKSVTDVPSNYIGGYLKWPDNSTPKNFKETREVTMRLVEKNLGIKVESICNVQRWKFAMPNLRVSEVRQYRELQGKNNIWFAGDYLGLPSMDTAVYTGRMAAKNILKKTTL